MMGAIERMKYGDHTTPVVSIPKPDGRLMLCRITVNPALYTDLHTILKAKDLFATLAGVKKFSYIT